jgi:hypothetical protein
MKRCRYATRFFCHKIVRDWTWQLTLIPSITLCRNKQHFIATGEYGDAWVLSFSFLFWDFGIKIYQD